MLKKQTEPKNRLIDPIKYILIFQPVKYVTNLISTETKKCSVT
jgi:hypothetical protein